MKIMVAIPCMDMMHTVFVGSLVGLHHPEGSEVNYRFRQSSLIYDSRNRLAQAAVEEGFDRVLWLDSDMVFDNDLLLRLFLILDNMPDAHFVSGLFFTRRQPIRPTFFRDVHPEQDKGGHIRPVAEHYFDYPIGQLFEVAGVGFGAVLMDVSMLKAVTDKFGLPFSPAMGFGEDLSFCCRARELGYRLYVDGSTRVGHIMQQEVGEAIYLATKAANAAMPGMIEDGVMDQKAEGAWT